MSRRIKLTLTQVYEGDGSTQKWRITEIKGADDLNEVLAAFQLAVDELNKRPRQ